MSLFIFWLTREVVVGLKWLLLFDFVPAVCYVLGGSPITLTLWGALAVVHRVFLPLISKL